MDKEAEQNGLRYYQGEGRDVVRQVVRFSSRPFHAAEIRVLVGNGDGLHEAGAASPQKQQHHENVAEKLDRFRVEPLQGRLRVEHLLPVPEERVDGKRREGEHDDGKIEHHLAHPVTLRVEPSGLAHQYERQRAQQPHEQSERAQGGQKQQVGVLSFLLVAALPLIVASGVGDESEQVPYRPDDEESVEDLGEQPGPFEERGPG